MTLFLLLVTIASITPVLTVGMQIPRLPPVGAAVGLVVAGLFGSLQFWFHHRFSAWFVPKCERHLCGAQRWFVGEVIVVVYYVSILAGGIACAWLADVVSRSVVFRPPEAVETYEMYNSYISRYLG